MRQLIDEEDWHGVADAAADIREIEAEIRGLKDRALFSDGLQAQSPGYAGQDQQNGGASRA